MTDKAADLLESTSNWLRGDPQIRAAVLFGSSAQAPGTRSHPDRWSDIDIQVIASDPSLVEKTHWESIFAKEGYCLHIARAATGNVRKVTVLFRSGQIDLVVVPYSRVRLARLGLSLGLHRKFHRWDVALNEIRTSMQFGYCFIKGGAEWGDFYAKILRDMPGVRLSDESAQEIANTFLCDMVWVLQKTDRGELLAARLMIHQSLFQTLFRLMRELQMRRDKPLQSFGLARHMETSLTAEELELVQIETVLQKVQLRGVAWRAYQALKSLMVVLVPSWTVPEEMAEFLVSFTEK